MDRMKVIGKDGEVRYEITDKVKSVFYCQCDNPRPYTTAVALTTRQITFQSCSNCGGRIKKLKEK